MTWRLGRTKQCAKCPWKVSTNPHDIPDGYSVEKHRALADTIATPGMASLRHRRAMSCHEHSTEESVHCVGWLVNQLGPGNNIGLRMRMLDCENARDIEVFGEQHRTFEDTLPEDEND